MSWSQVAPLNPLGQLHLKLPLDSDVHDAPFLHGDDAQWFLFSQFLPGIVEKKIVGITYFTYLIRLIIEFLCGFCFLISLLGWLFSVIF